MMSSHLLSVGFVISEALNTIHYAILYSKVSKLKQTFTQYPAIHTNYSLSNYTISNKKDFNRSSDFLVIN